ncbi:NADH-quinone oxidoreductase subunit L [Amycolatopsis rubida]|uniref:NADH-quinone oxidoreductase subunit L n=1 Tax=Amycolatopsis rubida TaxID=112413 RepID=A0ABX0C1W5_9PSEU|nr:NADH-quinone oxidoreductase subunit L [Amycolatopsis sp. M39]MYW94046.1 NADH-quinone oxidoreductase subunit L [Amycolatopsis rubida]NEC59035.1 NADH-quinone oxidoreductase subunit L [Amycolatopsis rubida]OAP22080.1 NADH-quinone oxidoreductase subunit 12 [Amycolatopsis sp. M39]
MTASSWLLVALPALGALVLLLSGKRAKAWGHLLGSATVTLAFVYAVILFFSTDSHSVTDTKVYSWIPVTQLQVDFGLRIDALSLTFVLLITGVGMLIHFYSIGYMEDDEGRYRFFAYLNLFVASMLILVLGNSFVTLYLGWEGVGLASYLLIGWYQNRPSAATAAKKAFLMNRVGDVGLALAIFLMFKYVGSTGYAQVFEGVAQGKIPPGAITAIAILLLLGACGKSGQFPLQAWLPDAMEGPTPVSALIHAATMVTAGVYLVARSNVIFTATPDGRLVVTLVGAVTLLLGCIVGCAYDDIKKVLAYSTVSQIGYMMLAVGLGPGIYALGIMHLVAHGFFKAGLFLGAGSVMHGMNDEVDMRKFGGLAKKMPITFVTFGLGYLAIIGFPFLTGYYTKDAIIEAAFGQEGWRGWAFGLATVLGAGLTAFYMTRLMMMTFFGKARWKDIKSTDGRDFHPHESKPIMWIPMAILAVGSVGAGAFFALGNRFVNWLAPVVGEHAEAEHTPIPSWTVPAATLVLAALGVLLAVWLFRPSRDVPVERPERVAWPVRAARKDLYGNALNETLVARPGTWLARALVYVDNRGVDGAVNGLAAALGGGSGRLRRMQTGFVRSYALSMLGGTFLLLAALLLVRFS